MDKNIVSEVAHNEGISVGHLKQMLSQGKAVIFYNRVRPRKVRPVAVGKNLLLKVNANIGTSPERVSLQLELEKLQKAISAGADTVMDLSTGGNIQSIRRKIIANSSVPVGTVPIYQVICDSARRRKDFWQVSPEEIFQTIEEQCQDGVDFITVHCGVTKKTVGYVKKAKRVCGIVSRGGAFLASWIIANNRENPLYEQFDRLCEIARRYDVVLSLGDGLRPGAIADADDICQWAEIKVLGELVLRARKLGVGVIVEGPGHMPLNRIHQHIRRAKKIIHDAPYYVLGPLVTDIACGYDHINGAIGAAVAGLAGADFLCYVTPAEHLRLPDEDDVFQGVIAAKIAAHAADVVRNKKAAGRDYQMSIARKKLDWEGQKKFALDKNAFLRAEVKKENVCSMCGSFCAMRRMNLVGI